MSNYLIVAAVIFLAALIAFGIWRWQCARRSDDTYDPERTPFFFIPMVAAVLVAAYALVHDLQDLSPPDLGPRPVTIYLDDQCGPPSVDDSGIVSVVLRLDDTGEARIVTCARMTRRPYEGARRAQS